MRAGSVIASGLSFPGNLAHQEEYVRFNQSRLLNWIVKASAALIALPLAVVSAKAGSVPSLIGSPVANGSNFDFNYQIALSNGQLNPAATNGITCPGPGVLVQCNPRGTFVTIYDISGFVSATTTAGGWTVTNQLVGVTPSNINTSDNATLMNVTFTYTGPIIDSGLGITTFTGFQIVSSQSGEAIGTFTSQDTNNTPGLTDGLTEQVIGSVAVPAGTDGSPTSTPEPSSVLLFGSGLVALARIARRKHSIG